LTRPVYRTRTGSGKILLRSLGEHQSWDASWKSNHEHLAQCVGTLHITPAAAMAAASAWRDEKYDDDFFDNSTLFAGMQRTTHLSWALGLLLHRHAPCPPSSSSPPCRNLCCAKITAAVTAAATAEAAALSGPVDDPPSPRLLLAAVFDDRRQTAARPAQTPWPTATAVAWALLLVHAKAAVLRPEPASLYEHVCSNMEKGRKHKTCKHSVNTKGGQHVLCT